MLASFARTRAREANGMKEKVSSRRSFHRANGIQESAVVLHSQGIPTEPGRPRWLGTLGTIVLTSVLTGATTVGGILLTTAKQHQQWVAEKQYNIEGDLLKRRLDILERFLRVSRRDGEFITLEALRSVGQKQIEDAAKTHDLTTAYNWIREGKEDARRYDEIYGEYLAVLNMAAALFGDKTRAAEADIIATHNPDVWKATEEQRARMVGAMSGELLLNMEETPGEYVGEFRASAQGASMTPIPH